MPPEPAAPTRHHGWAPPAISRRACLLLLAPLLISLPAAGRTTDGFVEIAPGLFVRPGEVAEATADNNDDIANIGFIIGRDSVAVVDPGGSLADGNTLRAAILARTELPIRYVIITHVHPDHLFGAQAFLPDQPTFIGHAKLPAAIADRGEYYQKRLRILLGDQAGEPVVPDHLVGGTDQIDLGNRVLDLQAHGAAHSHTDLTVFDRNTSTLWAADLLFVGRVPSLDGSLTGWLKELAALTEIPAQRAVPGHGPVSVPWPEGAADERRYLELLAHDIRAVLAQGGDLDTALPIAAQSEASRWSLFDDYNKHNIALGFHELEWENVK
jgi:quinoprotein relay system zinc metallohydrolase 2